MAQVSINIRIDEDVKKEFSEVCTDLGMNITTAFNIFAKKVINERGIPFEVNLKKSNKETFFKVLENIPTCDKEEEKEILTALNSMTEEDKKIVESKVVEW